MQTPSQFATPFDSVQSIMQTPAGLITFLVLGLIAAVLCSRQQRGIERFLLPIVRSGRMAFAASILLPVAAFAVPSALAVGWYFNMI